MQTPTDPAPNPFLKYRISKTNKQTDDFGFIPIEVSWKDKIHNFETDHPIPFWLLWYCHSYFLRVAFSEMYVEINQDCPLSDRVHNY